MTSTSPANDGAETPNPSQIQASGAAGDDTPRFSFRCRNRSFDAWTQNDGDGPSVYVSCEVGFLPYSAENRDGRRSALLLLSNAGTIARTRLMLTDFHKISVVAKARIADQQDPVGLLSSAAAAVLGSLPLIELMSSCLGPDPDQAPA